MNVLALVFVMLLIAGFSALPIYFTWWRPKKLSESWIAAARELGLEVQAPPTKHHPVYVGPMVGERAGYRVECRVRSEGSRNSTTYFTRVTIELPHPLGAELYVRPVGGLGRAWNAMTGEKDIQLGDAEIDPFYSISGIEERVELLLSQAVVREALRGHAKNAFGLHLRDRRLFLEGRGLQFEAATLRGAMEAGLDVAERLIGAQEAVKQEPRWEASAYPTSL